MDTGGEVGVVQREFALGLQEQVGQIVGRVAAVRGLTADGDGFPVSVTFVEGAAGGGDVHVDEFGHADPHAFQVFQGLFIGQDAGFHVLLVEGIEVLVHTAVGDGGTGLLFQTGEHLGEVLGLNGFVEVASRVGGHVFGVFSHAAAANASYFLQATALRAASAWRFAHRTMASHTRMVASMKGRLST